MVLDVMKAGALIVAGTDTPNAINLHGELMSYVLAGSGSWNSAQLTTRAAGLARLLVGSAEYQLV